MRTALLPTQILDIEKIRSANDLPNFSEPGTGKTITTIGAIEATKLQSGLIIGPPSSLIMWRENLEHELGARVQILWKRNSVIDKLADFLVMSYAVTPYMASPLMGRDNGALVVDESQYIKSPEAQRTQAIMGPECDGADGLYETSKQCWTLTGTPIERYADDLWSQLRATQPDTLYRYSASSLEAFRLQFCRMAVKEYAEGKVRKYTSVESSNELLLNRMLYKDIGIIRRTMDEVDPFMPETTERLVSVAIKMTAELKAKLKHLSEEAIEKMIAEDDPALVLLRQDIGLAKAADVVAYIKEQVGNGPVLVGYWHTQVGRTIQEQLRNEGITVEVIGGSTPTIVRDKIRRQMIDGQLQVIVGQIQATGTAMDGLQTVCRQVIFAELDWSAAKIEQFYKRAARKGQRYHVQVDYCLSPTVIDEAIQRVYTRKNRSARKVLTE